MRLSQSAASRGDVPDATRESEEYRKRRKAVILLLIGLFSTVEAGIMGWGIWHSIASSKEEAARAEARRVGIIADKARVGEDGAPLLEGPLTPGGPTWGKSQWADIEWLENGWFLFGRDGAWETDPHTRRYALIRFRNKSGRKLYNVQVPIELYTDTGYLRTDVCTLGDTDDGLMRRKTCGPIPASVSQYRALGFKASWNPVKSAGKVAVIGTEL